MRFLLMRRVEQPAFSWNR